MKLTYYRNGDYLLPDLAVNETDQQPLGIFVAFLRSLPPCVCLPLRRLRIPGEPTAGADTMTAVRASTISTMDTRHISTPTASAPTHRPR